MLLPKYLQNSRPAQKKNSIVKYEGTTIAEKENPQAQKERNARQLRRLQTLIDVVFALLIFRLFTLLPHPIAPETGSFDPLMIFTEGGERFVMFIIGFVLVTIYWFQNKERHKEKFEKPN